ncbi:hypothetical protein EZV62_002414 [Acer yangbiense]|uniref:Retroviral polymerase SH3-like domain-containing protein n=1 Tax=Acer yangbiense TaxID=1000413 RepID=A0A5C7IX78_9ROSI|nr:hypothetical protein EZV62_002414 [Acer yangbiense]
MPLRVTAYLKSEEEEEALLVLEETRKALLQSLGMATENTQNFVQPSIPRFDGHYDHWSMLMENFLKSKEYWQVVDSGVAKLAEGVVLTDAQRTEREGLQLKDLKAKNYLFQAIDRSILETILSELIEDEVEAEVLEAEETMIVEINNNTSTKMMSDIPKNFWPEVVNWSIHILNRSPTLAVQNMTPEEAWSGRRPSVNHFKICGCIAYAHIPDEKRKKLDDKGEKCIFLGVSDQSKAYKLYNPSTKKIVMSRDVVFDEERFWLWNNNAVRQQILADFDGENEDERQQPVENEQDPIPIATQDEQRPQRARTRPAWMTDYEEGFRKCPHEYTLFVKIGDGGKMLIMCLYVDDLIYTGNDSAMFDKFKKSMMVNSICLILV